MSKNLYWKIQTIPATKELQPDSVEYNLFRNKNKNQETGELLSEKDTLELWVESAGKNPLFGSLLALSVAFVDEDSNSIRVKVFKGQEKAIIQSFINTCNSEFFKGYKITGYNFSFLLPFLRSRMLKNGMNINSLPSDIQDYNKRSWNVTGLDIMSAYNGGGWFQNSLEELAYLCNINTNFVDGKDVYSYYLEGREKELEESIIEENVALANCHRTIIGENKVETVNASVEIVGDVEEVKVPILEQIFKSEQITDKQKEELKNLLSKKKIAKKDKPIIKEIITRLYINCEMFKSDKLEIVKRKELEIEELINSL